MTEQQLKALTDFEFEQLFSAQLIPPSLFSHEAHLRLAWINIQLYGLDKALEKVSSCLKNYVAHVGAEEKFNATLTIAAVKAVSHFMKKSDAEKFKDFILQFPRLKYQFKELMACHYGFDIYHSPEAKQYFLEPDLLPFD